MGGVEVAPQSVICKVIHNREIARGIFDMSFACPGMAELARPGQFVHIACGEGNLLRRPISIADILPGALRVIYEVKGEGTRYLSQLKEGDPVDVLGPLGRGFDLSRASGNAILIGGGIGVFPLLPVAKLLGKRAYVALGFRSASAAVLTEEFSAVSAGVHIATDDGSMGYHGFVTDMAEMLSGVSPTILYACGPKPMLKNVKLLAEKFGVPAEISMEERMGCGIGACLVCACKTRKNGEEGFSHVCKDGPVFDASEVIFE